MYLSILEGNEPWGNMGSGHARGALALPSQLTSRRDEIGCTETRLHSAQHPLKGGPVLLSNSQAGYQAEISRNLGPTF